MAWQIVITVIAFAVVLVWVIETRLRVSEGADIVETLTSRVRQLEEAHDASLEATKQRIHRLQTENSRLRRLLGEENDEEDVFPARQNMRVSFVKRGGTEYDEKPGGTQP
jgi:hypothetical protein